MSFLDRLLKCENPERSYDLTTLGLSAQAIEAAHYADEPLLPSIMRAAAALSKTDRFRALMLIKALALVSPEGETRDNT